MISGASFYTQMEINRLEREQVSKQAFYREQWLRSRSAEAVDSRGLLRWAGDRLVNAGERLRAWSAPHPVGSR